MKVTYAFQISLFCFVVEQKKLQQAPDPLVLIPQAEGTKVEGRVALTDNGQQWKRRLWSVSGIADPLCL